MGLEHEDEDSSTHAENLPPLTDIFGDDELKDLPSLPLAFATQLMQYLQTISLRENPAMGEGVEPNLEDIYLEFLSSCVKARIETEDLIAYLKRLRKLIQARLKQLASIKIQMSLGQSAMHTTERALESYSKGINMLWPHAVSLDMLGPREAIRMALNRSLTGSSDVKVSPLWNGAFGEA